MISQLDKTFWTGLFYKKNCPLDGQTRQAKSSSQLVNLPRARPLINKTPGMLFLQPHGMKNQPYWEDLILCFHSKFYNFYTIWGKGHCIKVLIH